MSWFSKAETGPVQNFYPITTYAKGYGALSDKDTHWACISNRGFITETQTWYSVLDNGCFISCQVIWSYVGVFVVPATSQFLFKHYDPKTKKVTWRSVHGSGFKTNGSGCRSDQFEVKHEGSSTTAESFTISASIDKNVQVNVKFERPADAPGFKYGEGEDGGFSIFGKDKADGKRDGFVVHRFHPWSMTTGSIIIDGQVVDAKGNGMFVHAIQGMRPDSVASRWNFAFFTTGGGEELGKLGTVRAIQMELETTDSYGPLGPKTGRTKVNIGALYVSTKKPNPILVVGQTSAAGSESYPTVHASSDISSTRHFTPVHDTQTGYDAPSGLEVNWSGESRDGGKASAKLTVDKLGAVTGDGGLIEKVDVLAEIPFVIKKALSATTGIKPFIFQYLNPSTLEVELDGETIPVKGYTFNEASFISNA